eukprot:gb/GECG01011786.1/.p1 GENE.gb/GECG01011786.1/~~gb/GECG01011786.1/.p1  ORF type:complete len:496 (+),score=75.49 gb/GECG01011786.1/:1-1488(+)
MGCSSSKQEQQVSPNKKYDVAPQEPEQSVRDMTGEELRTRYQAIADDFKLGKVLGKGSFGEVRLATYKPTGESRAIKILSKIKFGTKEDRHHMKNEKQLMELVSGHPNVLNLIEAREDKMNYYLIMEHCKGKELMDKIVEKKGNFSEQVAAQYFRQMCQAVRHCHKRKVMHRDLKPENFIFEDEDDSSNLKLADFGLSAYLPSQNAILSEACGSSYYMAPEMFRHRYTKAADIWSLGIILYLLLSGRVPFGMHVETEPEIYTAIQRDRLKFRTKHWKGISKSAITLIADILRKNPKERPSLDDILENSWVKGETAKTQALNKKIVESMYNFNNRNKFKKHALKWIASTLKTEDIEQLREAFYAMDKNNSGIITFQELEKAISYLGLNGAINVRELMNNLDTDGDGHISYEEFLAATAERQLINHQQHVWYVFCQYDLDGDGYITADELRQALADEPPEEIEEYIKEFDRDGDGVIDYEEFIRMVLPKDVRIKPAE